MLAFGLFRMCEWPISASTFSRKNSEARDSGVKFAPFRTARESEMLKLISGMTVAAALVFSQASPGIAADAKKKPAATMTKKKVEKTTYWAPWLLTSSARTITCERPCTRYEARVCCYGDP